MRTLALALSVAVLGTGCFIDADDDDFVPGARGDAIVYWEFIRNAPAQPDGFVVYDASLTGTSTGACPESGIVTVRVTSVAGSVDVNCQEWNPSQGLSVQGIIVGNLPAGTQTIRVRGYRGNVLVADWSQSVTVIEGQQVEVYVSVEPVQANAELYAYLAFGDPVTDYPTCAAAGNPNISYALYDGAGTLVDEDVVACSDPLPAFVVGQPLDLDDYTVRMQGRATSGPTPGAVVFDSCGVAFEHFAAQVGAQGVAVDLLTLPVPVCPGS